VSGSRAHLRRPLREFHLHFTLPLSDERLALVNSCDIGRITAKRLHGAGLLMHKLRG